MATQCYLGHPCAHAQNATQILIPRRSPKQPSVRICVLVIRNKQKQAEKDVVFEGRSRVG